MALIKCPECNNKISDQALSCPKCGYSLKSESSKKEVSLPTGNSKYLIVLAIVVALFLGYTFFSNKKVNSSNPNNNPSNNQNNSNNITPSANEGYSIYNSKDLDITFEFPNSYQIVTDNQGFTYIASSVNQNNPLVPYIVVGRNDNYQDPYSYLVDFTNEMKKNHSDLYITINILSNYISDKLVYGVAYNYYVDGHLIVDNRYALIVNKHLYMVGTIEENTNSSAINAVTRNIIMTMSKGGN